MNQKNTKTFEASDCMNLKAFADDLFNNIQIENLLSENSVVISLNAKFGMGKSHFLEMFENYLKDEKQAETILINSWKNDFCDEPLIAICSEIIKYLQEKADKESIPISEQSKSIIGILGDISNQFIVNKTGLNIKEIYGKNKHQIDGNKISEQFVAKRNLFNKLNQSIAEYTAEKQLIILIDELDRTRPDYAINFLETLKHFFDVKGLIFILAVNKEQLKQSVECVYGKIDFDEYYRKFAHTRKDVDSNIEFFKNKFNGKIEFDPIMSEFQLELGGYNEDNISPIKSIGKKILQSKKLFDQL